MTRPTTPAAASGLSIRVDTARRRIRLRSPLLTAADPGYRTRLLCRVLACRDVEGVDLNTAIGEAVLRLAAPDVTARSLQATLAELSAGIRGDRASLAPESLPRDCFRRGVVSISRYAGQLSTWQITLDSPGANEAPASRASPRPGVRQKCGTSAHCHAWGSPGKDRTMEEARSSSTTTRRCSKQVR